MYFQFLVDTKLRNVSGKQDNHQGIVSSGVSTFVVVVSAASFLFVVVAVVVGGTDPDDTDDSWEYGGTAEVLAVDKEFPPDGRTAVRLEDAVPSTEGAARMGTDDVADFSSSAVFTDPR